MKRCRVCGVRLRPYGSKPEDYPFETRARNGTRCFTCIARARREREQPPRKTALELWREGAPGVGAPYKPASRPRRSGSSPSLGVVIMNR